jgi:hypothetical protein
LWSFAIKSLEIWALSPEAYGGSGEKARRILDLVMVNARQEAYISKAKIGLPAETADS